LKVIRDHSIHIHIFVALSVKFQTQLSLVFWVCVSCLFFKSATPQTQGMQREELKMTEERGVVTYIHVRLEVNNDSHR
jgi:hypothetical protein